MNGYSWNQFTAFAECQINSQDTVTTFDQITLSFIIWMREKSYVYMTRFFSLSNVHKIILVCYVISIVSTKSTVNEIYINIFFEEHKWKCEEKSVFASFKCWDATDEIKWNDSSIGILLLRMMSNDVICVIYLFQCFSFCFLQRFSKKIFFFCQEITFCKPGLKCCLFVSLLNCVAALISS
jgi:hypothetical protein